MSKPAPITLAVAGALGRMGRAAAAAAAGREDVRLIARLGRPGGEGEGLATVDQAMTVDVVVDFTTPDASVALARRCAERRAAGHGGPALVIGSTGFDPAQADVLAEAATRVAIVRSGNFSLGVNVLLGLVRRAAAALPSCDYDIEIAEAHHRRKLDAPSGTALMLGEAAAAGRGVALSDLAVRAREGITGPRETGAIGFSVVRGGGVVGEHSVLFAAEDEILTLSHSARDRSLFARGAMMAALWVAGRPPGLYDMQDVLGFSSDPAR